ncbi:MAG: hypothetical protein HQ564_05645 [Candidatus Saganbacteria bacterium]|nr:hypothetical protein [Candidatus Saganbacteria bacterium]
MGIPIDGGVSTLSPSRGRESYNKRRKVLSDIPGVKVAQAQTIDHFIAKARHGTPSEKRAAVRRLEQELRNNAYDTKALEALVDLTNDPDLGVRKEARSVFNGTECFDYAIALAEKAKQPKKAALLISIALENTPKGVNNDSGIVRMAQFQKQIYENPLFNGKRKILARRGVFSVFSYAGIPFYSLVLKGEKLITIIPSVRPLRVIGKSIIARYPFGFKVKFSNFPKTINRNNWCLELLYKMPKAFFRGIKVLNFSHRKSSSSSGDFDDSGRINVYFNASNGRTIPHEIGHYWYDKLSSRDERKTFKAISWKRSWGRLDGDKNNFRGGAVPPCRDTNFCARGPVVDVFRESHPYGMENQFEDAATVTADYFAEAVSFRLQARSQMKKNKFELAVKYLVFRYLSPANGKEYDIGANSYLKSPSLTINEVKSAMDTYLKANPKGVRKGVIDALNKVIMRASLMPTDQQENKTKVTISPKPMAAPPVNYQKSPSFSKLYPLKVRILFNANNLKKYGLTKEDFKDKKDGWRKASKALYKTEKYADDLKKINFNADSPASAYARDFTLPGEMINIAAAPADPGIHRNNSFGVKVLFDPARLKSYGLKASDLKDKADGWEKISKALYGITKYESFLRKINMNAASPSSAYSRDLFLSGELINLLITTSSVKIPGEAPKKAPPKPVLPPPKPKPAPKPKPKPPPKPKPKPKVKKKPKPVPVKKTGKKEETFDEILDGEL